MRSQTLEIRPKAFHLPSFLSNYDETASKAEKAGWAHVRYLETLAELEAGSVNVKGTRRDRANGTHPS